MTRSLALLAVLAAPAAAGSRNVSGAVVSSDAWTLKERGKQEVFTGNVRYRKDADRVRADWALHERDSDRWRATGGLEVDSMGDDGSTLQLRRGARGAWDGKTGRGEVHADKAPLEFTWISSSGTYHARSQEGRADETKGVAVLKGNVRIWGPRGKTWSETATYHKAEERLDLEGRRPVVQSFEDGNVSAFQADRTVVWQGEERVRGEGRVVGWIVPKSGGAAR